MRACAALLLWFCCVKPRPQRDAAAAADAKAPPLAPVGVHTAEPFNQNAFKDPAVANLVRPLHESGRRVDTALCAIVGTSSNKLRVE